MIPVLTTEEAYKLDKDTIDTGYLSQNHLMDNAGKAIAQFFCEKVDNPFKQKVVIVCGKGLNGGDGIIAHSYLKHYGVSSEIIFTEKNYVHSKLREKYKISECEYYIYNDKTKFDEYDWIIDGIFGIGLSRALDSKYIDLIEKINDTIRIISIDVPSGITDSENDNIVIIPKHTITFGYSKLSHYINPINNLQISDIGLKKNTSSSIFKINSEDIKIILNPIINKKNIHKKNSQCNIIAGSIYYPGAAYLCSMAANKSGSGYVTLYTNSENNLIDNLQSMMPEIIVRDLKYFSSYKNNFPILIGPGGQSIFSIDEQNDIQNDIDKFVIDASAISIFDSPKSIAEDDIVKIPEFSIMTPHVGEFKNFFRIHKDRKIDLNLLESIKKIIGLRIVILKSFNTFIITEEMIYIIDIGPSLLSTAGTGDVLSGILVSLLSQGYSRLDASILGTYLHAEAANYYMNNISKDGMTAIDLIDCIPMAFNILRDND